VVAWVESDTDDPTDQNDGQLIDVSQVSESATDDVVDAGVTSGSDPNVWDPVTVGNEDRSNACDGGGQGTAGAAICHTEKK
jgi:hypothetical protein